MGKNRVIAETGAGQHGVATATACAKMKLKCCIYMGSTDIKRQLPNVEKMRLLGAEVIEVTSGSKTLKDAVNAALRDYAQSFANTHYCLGSALGPHPFPQMVAFFQEVIGRETKEQCYSKFGKDPDMIIACIGGGSNSIGIFREFLNNKNTTLVGVEAFGNGKKHASRFHNPTKGVLHGTYSYVMQEKDGNIMPTHSISAGLDYPMIGPEHAYLYDKKLVKYTQITDKEALDAFKLLSNKEGIIPALESAHALAYYVKESHKLNKNACIVVNLSGRGDKDLASLNSQGLLK